MAKGPTTPARLDPPSGETRSLRGPSGRVIIPICKCGTAVHLLRWSYPLSTWIDTGDGPASPSFIQASEFYAILGKPSLCHTCFQQAIKRSKRADRWRVFRAYFGFLSLCGVWTDRTWHGLFLGPVHDTPYVARRRLMSVIAGYHTSRYRPTAPSQTGRWWASVKGRTELTLQCLRR